MNRQEFEEKLERGIAQVRDGQGIVKTMEEADADPHPRLLLEGRGIHAGEGFTALFPDGWHDITLEVRWEMTGPGCWFISTPGFSDICPIGLFVKV